jgi:prepilin-type N-terminal cleavage/methylation domain-containing protein
MMEAPDMLTIHIPSKQRATAFNRGFTLLELLIALLIGSIVIAVVGGFKASRKWSICTPDNFANC